MRSGSRPTLSPIAIAMVGALLLCSVSATASPLGQPGGGGGDDEGVANADLILAAGATAVVVGLIVYDILTDTGEETAEDSTSTSIEDTGVEWGQVEVAEGAEPSPAEDETAETRLTVVLEVLPVEQGSEASAELADALGLLLAGTRFDVRPNPVNIGSGYSAAEKARMAADFFGSNLFVSMQRSDEGSWRIALLDETGTELAADFLPEPDAESIALLVSEALPQ